MLPFSRERNLFDGANTHIPDLDSHIIVPFGVCFLTRNSMWNCCSSDFDPFEFGLAS